VPYGDLDAMRDAIGEQTAAVIVEPIQAEGGIIVGSDEYLRGLRDLTTARGALLLFDEVQTGYGRTGTFLAREHSGVVPDACSLAKGIAGGVPLGAMLVTERVADGLPRGSHASTFGGNPLACAAGLAVLSIFDEEKLVERCLDRGRFLGSRLEGLAARFPGTVRERRGRGLLQGLQLAPEVDVPALLSALRDRRVLLTAAGGDVLRFAPPLVVSEAELTEGLESVEAVLADPPRKETT
jgi:acetylornithine/succinyldiaminopimelate/putrescine aminotransferase